MSLSHYIYLATSSDHPHYHPRNFSDRHSHLDCNSFQHCEALKKGIIVLQFINLYYRNGQIVIRSRYFQDQTYTVWEYCLYLLLQHRFVETAFYFRNSCSYPQRINVPFQFFKPFAHLCPVIPNLFPTIHRQ